ncbi:MAG TPA: carboxypeptidase-like regulatory domain-containing protein, partial [Vicinamibacterales bacterium]|nr:carboxypeptidase-like regulatory domain-containing protein [Vicinamibacterales bacterium]
MLSQIRSCLVVCILATLTLMPAGVTAQESRGTLQGRVIDTSGAAVPGASVEVLNLATGVAATTTTNEQGGYRVAFLNPGIYRVTVSLTGFGKFISDKIELHVADVLTVDATLKVGGLSDEVTVSATAATVDRTTAEL